MNQYHVITTTANGVERVVDFETGEVKVVASESTHYVQSYAQRDTYRKKLEREQAIQRGRSKNWVACYHDAVKSLSSKLSLEELGAVFLLLPYLKLNGRNDGQLVMKGHRMGVKEISRAVGKGKRRTKELTSRLVDATVLYRERDGRHFVYGISLEYHTIGKVASRFFTKVYQQFSLTLKEEFDLSIQLAGVLYAILPYFHFKTYLLCTNPNEQDDAVLDPMTDRELAELLGVDRSTVNRLLSQLVRRGVIAKIGSNGACIYRVNPDLMYRMDIETDFTKAIRADFVETMRSYKKENQAG